MAHITLLTFLSPLLALVCAPLLLGIIGKTKAFFAGRKGPPVLQTYFDIIKLLQKGAVYSTTASWIFKAGPMVSLSALVCAACILPFGALGAPISFSGDILLFAYLLGVVRFFTVLAALDTGSAFEGMGTSREVFYSALAEPVFLLCIIALARSGHGFRFVDLYGGMPSFSLVCALLSGAALFVVALAENARIPVDDPLTHLELTMIHEVMVLDHSGPDFAFINYSASIKLWLFCCIVVRTLLPLHPSLLILDILITLCGMVAVAIIIGIVESVMARLRLLRVPQLLAAAGALAVLAILSGEGVLL